MASQSSRKKPTPVKDANLLDDETDTLILHFDDDDADSPPHVGGKNLQLLENPSEGKPTYTSPPRALSPSKAKIPPTPQNTGTLKHITKLDVYIHTANNKTLQKIISTQFGCHKMFYTQPHLINSIIQRAEHLIMRQEPFNTLLNQGYNFSLSQPQMSYRVLTLEENTLIDFVVDLADEQQRHNPVPFYESNEEHEYTRTDVSYLFNINPMPEPESKPSMVDQSTITFDHDTISPFIDQFRSSASKWNTKKRQPSPSRQHTPPATSTQTEEHQKVDEGRQRDREHRPQQQRVHPQARLGPPVAHDFRDRSRSTSHERNQQRSDNRHQYRSNYRGRPYHRR
jgi:hypothetical protein